jgi:hypothetical protein
MRQSKTVISLVILLVIALHVVPIISKARRKTIWPILDWAMYKNAQPPGPIQADVKHLIGVTSSGERVALTSGTIGVSSFVIQQLYIVPIRSGDSSAARQLAERVNLVRSDPFVEIRLESERYTATDTGVVRNDNPAISYQIDPPPRDEVIP